MKIFVVLSESLETSGTLPFTVFSFQRYKLIKIGKMIEKMVHRSGYKSTKLIQSVTSCGGHLAQVDLSMHYSSANTCQ